MALTLRWRTGRRITLPHYHEFGTDRRLVGDDLVRPEAWDALRTASDSYFSIPTTRAEWEQKADEWGEVPLRARSIDRWLRAHRVGSLASYGVGGASLELWLHRLCPERSLVITEFGSDTVARLQSLFTEVEVRNHDLLTDDPLDAELHLFSRIDPSFSNEEWKSILHRFADRRMLVATDMIDLKRMEVELRKGHTRPRPTWAGFIRNRAALEALWQRTHRSQFLRLGDLDAWALEPRR